VGTTTVDDLTAYATGYSSNTLSEPIGDYTRLPSCEFMAADNDRLLLAGSFWDTSKQSRVYWTPTALAPGVGNDERYVLSTDPFLDLDGFEGGKITGMIGGGTVYVWKNSQTYRIVKTGVPKPAYDAQNISKVIGALPGSMFQGFDASGNAAVFFTDRNIGPCMIGVSGLIQTGLDVKNIWDGRATTLNDLTNVSARGTYYPDKRQARWAFTESGQTTTSKGLWLHTNHMVLSREGGRRGWTTVTGNAYTGVTDMILYSDNVESGAARSTKLVPLVSRADASGHHVVIGESGTTDDSVDYAASIRSRPFILGGGSNRFGIRTAALIANAGPGVTVAATLTRDFGKETKAVTGISLAAGGSETLVMPDVDNIFMSEAKAVDVKIADSATPTGTWKLQQITLVPRKEQEA
jgi:hypothetical protein